MASMIDTEHFRGKAAATQTTGSGGGSVDDTQKRLAAVETAVSDIRVDIGAIKVQLSHCATKDDLKELEARINEVKGELSARVNEVRSELSHLATKAELARVEGSLREELARVEGSLRAELARVEGSLRAEMLSLHNAYIKWSIGTAITLTTVAFTIAKFVN